MSDLHFDHYTASGYGARFIGPPPGSRPVREELREDLRPFDKARYQEEIHGPVGVLSASHELDRPLTRCLDMPLRLAGSEVYALPQEWACLLPLLRRIIAIEHEHNPSAFDYNVYLTVDSSWQEPGDQQRHGGLHVDGFQGARIEEKTKINRSYVMSTNGGTRFYPQLFTSHWDEATYNLFMGFDREAGEPLIGEDFAVYFMDAYTVHESGFAARPGLRNFVRLSFDLKRFDRLGNSHNPMIKYSWPMVERNVQDTLVPPPGVS